MNENRLEFLKDEMDLKSKEIAKLLNVSESTYSEWEHNKIPIPTKRMIELADFYKVNIDYILKLTIRRLEITKAANLNLKEIGQRLLMIRKELNYSLRELGNILNCSFSALASYERGEKLIISEILINLSKISNHSIDWILGRTKKDLLAEDKKWNLKKLEKLENKKKLKQRDLAKILNVERSTYSGWETGKDTIPLRKLIELSNYYNLSIDYLTGLNNKKEYMFVSENINPIAIGKEIKIVRKEKNLKQKDLAKILKISPSTYSVYENGKILINTSFIYKFAKKFNCSIDNIIKKN